jgi:hypothetical protein
MHREDNKSLLATAHFTIENKHSISSNFCHIAIDYLEGAWEPVRGSLPIPTRSGDIIQGMIQEIKLWRDREWVRVRAVILVYNDGLCVYVCMYMVGLYE